MELSDIGAESCDRKAGLYENTEITAAAKTLTEQAETNEGHYEHLKFSSKTGENKCNQQEHALNRMKCIVYTTLAMLVLLYIITLVVIIVIAVPRAKVDGIWAHWSPWSICDVTCGNGTKTKYRTCTSPPPAEGGLYCSGSATYVAICQMSSCTVDGGWTQWSPWSICDVTCGNGTKTKYRTCTSPPPAEGGLYCSGNATVVAICQMSSCTGNRVSFAAKKTSKSPPTGFNQRIVFDDVLNNENNGYNSSTGIFRAPVGGVYLFVYFIEIGEAYGKVELRLDGNLINYAVAYGAYGISSEITVDISGFNHNVIIGTTDPDAVCRLECSSGRFSVAGFNNSAYIQPDLNKCYEKKESVATGGNSAVAYVRAGEKVWIQTSGDNKTLDVRPGGTTFTGVLLFLD